MRAGNIARNEGGSSAVEMALIAPLLVTFLIGIIELSIIMFVSLTMDTVVTNIARTGKTGYAAAGQSQQQTITAQINQQLGGLIDTTQLAITTTAYGDLSQIGQAGQGASGYGTASQVVVYSVSYPWHLLTPVLDQFLGSGGIYTITVRSVVKNEPYGQ